MLWTRMVTMAGRIMVSADRPVVTVTQAMVVGLLDTTLGLDTVRPVVPMSRRCMLDV